MRYVSRLRHFVNFRHANFAAVVGACLLVASPVSAVVIERENTTPAVPGTTVSLSDYYTIDESLSPTKFFNFLDAQFFAKSGDFFNTVGGQDIQGVVLYDSLQAAQVQISSDAENDIRIPGRYRWNRQFQDFDLPTQFTDLKSITWQIPVSIPASQPPEGEIEQVGIFEFNEAPTAVFDVPFEQSINITAPLNASQFSETVQLSRRLSKAFVPQASQISISLDITPEFVPSASEAIEKGSTAQILSSVDFFFDSRSENIGEIDLRHSIFCDVDECGGNGDQVSEKFTIVSARAPIFGVSEVTDFVVDIDNTFIKGADLAVDFAGGEISISGDVKQEFKVRTVNTLIDGFEALEADLLGLANLAAFCDSGFDHCPAEVKNLTPEERKLLGEWLEDFYAPGLKKKKVAEILEAIAKNLRGELKELLNIREVEEGFLGISCGNGNCGVRFDENSPAFFSVDADFGSEPGDQSFPIIIENFSPGDEIMIFLDDEIIWRSTNFEVVNGQILFPLLKEQFIDDFVGELSLILVSDGIPGSSFIIPTPEWMSAFVSSESVSVPEPGTMTLLGSGLFALVIVSLARLKILRRILNGITTLRAEQFRVVDHRSAAAEQTARRAAGG